MKRTCSAPFWFFALLFASAVLLLPMQAKAEPSLTQVLANKGLSMTDVAMAWRERPPSGASTIYGVHLNTNTDFYYDNTGVVLSDAQLASLGVVQKDWTWKSVTVPTEMPVTKKQMEPAPPPQPRSAGIAVPELALGQPDVEQAIFEDDLEASSPAKGVLRIGVFQEVAVPIKVSCDTATEGVWRTLADGGQVWSLRLSAAGAAGMRVHFLKFQCPAGAELVVYNADYADEAYGPFTASGEFWAPTCFGDSVGIELYLPKTASGDVALEIDRTTYQYRGLDSLTKTAAGVCNKDLACEGEAWKDIGAAVGGMGYIGLTGQLWCTGTLLADEISASSKPLFLTADHCVDSQNEASFVEVYWLYGATTCDTPSSVPLAASVPRTTGANYLVGAPRVSGSSQVVGTDVTLLRLTGTVPANIPHAGYTTEEISAGRDVTSIHHPQGTYKRISYGTSGLLATSFTPAEEFISVGWTTGTTETGSSGGPLFVTDSLNGILVTGQLYGGSASCAIPSGTDYFGRLSVSYPILQPYLTPAQYDLQVSIEGSGTVALSGHAGTIASGTVFPITEGAASPVLTATASANNLFRGWRINNGATLESSNPLTVAMTGDVSIVAVFVAGVKVTIQTRGDGRVMMGGAEVSGEVSVASGTELTLTAEPAASREFASWELSNSTDASTTNPLVLSPTENVTVTAVFNDLAADVKVTIQTRGDGQVMMGGAVVSGEISVASGTELTLTAWPAASRKFASWELSNSTDASTTNPLVLSPTENVTVTAVFKKLPLSICGATDAGPDSGSNAADLVLLLLLAAALAFRARQVRG